MASLSPALHGGKKVQVVFVMLTTGTGKSKLAIDLALHFFGEVINSDKMQVYKGLDVLTSKVTPEERQSMLCVALSTTEIKFIAITNTCKEMLYVKMFFNKLGYNQDRYIIYCDSQNAIHLNKNTNFHLKSKHIDVRYH